MRNYLFALVLSLALRLYTMDPYSRAIWRSMRTKLVILVIALAIIAVVEAVRRFAS